MITTAGQQTIPNGKKTIDERTSRHHTALAGLFLGWLTTVAFAQSGVYELKTNDQVLILGDSTTADGLLPAGYVPLTDQAQREQRPDLHAKVDGIGYAMSTSADVLKHFMPMVDQRLAKANPPTVTVVNIGLNDSKSGATGVAPYADNLRELVKQLRQRKQTAILCTPTTWGGLEQTKPYAAAARAVAAETQCLLIDLHAAHADHIVANTKNGKRLPGTDPTRDGTHLSAAGEALSAGTILKAFGLKPVWQEYQIRVLSMREGWATGVWGKFVMEPDRPSYAPGTKLTLTLVPKDGFVLSRWVRGDGAAVPETTPKLTITMDRHLFISAMVREDEPK